MKLPGLRSADQHARPFFVVHAICLETLCIEPSSGFCQVESHMQFYPISTDVPLLAGIKGQGCNRICQDASQLHSQQAMGEALPDSPHSSAWGCKARTIYEQHQ